MVVEEAVAKEMVEATVEVVVLEALEVLGGLEVG